MGQSQFGGSGGAGSALLGLLMMMDERHIQTESSLTNLKTQARGCPMQLQLELDPKAKDLTGGTAAEKMT